MKHVLSIQDLSCLVSCSLTVSLPVLSAKGCRCSVLPTAVLSTHTAFPAPRVVPLTEELVPFGDHWRSVGAEFDAISVGYLADPEQSSRVKQVLEAFPAFVVLDPVMGDHGKLYSRITPAHIAAIVSLAEKADVIVPNVTEAAALTGLAYRQRQEESYLRELGAGLQELGCDPVITGVRRNDDTIGVWGSCKGKEFFLERPYIGKSFHGTGDLFAAVLTGSLVKGASLEEAAKTAASFVARCIAETAEVTPHGVEFEKQLPLLWEK